MNVAIVKYNAGNIRSVDFALRRFGIEADITDNHDRLRSADRVIFPGVGEASSTMRHLHSTGLARLIPDLKQPVLGICLGLQLMCAHSEEGDVDGLGIFPLKVRKFRSNTPIVKVPHMGWNTLEHIDSPLLEGLGDDPFVYFVHSYYAEPGAGTIAQTPYIHSFSSALQRDNFYATQFHPEKSGVTGERILENFLRIPTLP